MKNRFAVTMAKIFAIFFLAASGVVISVIAIERIVMDGMSIMGQDFIISIIFMLFFLAIVGFSMYLFVGMVFSTSPRISTHPIQEEENETQVDQNWEQDGREDVYPLWSSSAEREAE
jgi:hypothetical protein